MNHKMKKMIATVLAFVLVFSFTITASAQENVGNGLILSAGTLTLTEGSSTVLVASMQEGFDASRLACVSANPGVATVTPVASMSNIANFQVNYVGNGSTVIAVYHMDNPAVVSYVTVNASPIVMEIPTKLGTNRDNYCTITGYEFVPYEFHKYADYSDYKNTLNISYRCDSYKDDGFAKWGCYGYFYDAAGNVVDVRDSYHFMYKKRKTDTNSITKPYDAVSWKLVNKRAYLETR